MASTKSRKLFYLGIVLVFLIIFHYLGVIRPLESVTRALIVPFSSSLADWKINYGDNYMFYQDRQKLIDDFRLCSAENQKLNYVEAANKSLTADNIELKKQLGFFSKKIYGKITTRIIGKNTDSLENMIIVEGGPEEGIKEGQPVVTGEGVLVGLVARVEKNESFVRLINDSRSKVAATILNNEKSLGVVEGGYGLSVRMNFIPRNEVIVVGDKVITSGLEQGIPHGLLIGEVAVAENEAYQPFQQAVLTTATDLSKLYIVSVITSIMR